MFGYFCTRCAVAQPEPEWVECPNQTKCDFRPMSEHGKHEAKYVEIPDAFAAQARPRS